MRRRKAGKRVLHRVPPWYRHRLTISASWRSGDAADCKSVYTGSIPVLASKFFKHLRHRAR